MIALEELEDLRDGEVQVWVLSDGLSKTGASPQALEPMDELEAQERPAAQRDRFRRGRAALRGALEVLLGPVARRLQIRRGLGGKPSCAGGIEFNLSHADGHLGIAFSRGLPLGLDLERKRQDGVDWTVARACFSEPELAAFEAAEAMGQGGEAFLRAWTRMEARLKLSGSGIGPFLPNSDAARSAGPAWIEDLQLCGGLTGALALHRAPKQLRVFQPQGLARLAGAFGGRS